MKWKRKILLQIKLTLTKWYLRRLIMKPQIFKNVNIHDTINQEIKNIQELEKILYKECDSH